MKMVRALLCTAMILSLNFNLIGQIANQKEELIQHVRDHVKPGMTQNQIDSLYERAKANKVKRDENIKELVLSAQKANNNGKIK